jgi:hypothetical protein
MDNSLVIWRRHSFWLLPLFVILVPTLPLLSVNAWFYHDWAVHTRYIAYTAEYLRAHWAFPEVLNFQDDVGIPLPIFYATTLFPIISIFSTAVGVNAGLRIVIWIALLMQFLSIRALFRSNDNSRPWAPFVAALSVWTIYSMTNLFNRAAIPEFFALGFFATGVAQFILYLQADRKSSPIHFFGSLLAFGLVTTNHPITSIYAALLSIPILGLSWHWSMIASRTKVKRVIALTSGLVLVSGAWIYAFLEFRSALRIKVISEYINRYRDIDIWFVRLMPFPLDFRTLMNGASRTETPFLEAQINFPLLILVVFLAYYLLRRGSKFSIPKSKGKWDLILPVGLAGVFFLASTQLDVWQYPCMIELGALTQFMYRLTGHINILLLLSFFALARRSPPALFHQGKTILAMALTLALVNAGIKTSHAYSVKRSSVPNIPENPGQIVHKWTSEPGAATDYSTPGLYRDWPGGNLTGEHEIGLQFKTDTADFFGDIPSQAVTLNHKAMVRTNVTTFPWNEILLDGVVVEKNDLFQTDGRIGFLVPEGKHEVSYRINSKPVFRILAGISRWTLAVCFAAILGLLLVPKKRSFKESVKAPNT